MCVHRTTQKVLLLTDVAQLYLPWKSAAHFQAFARCFFIKCLETAQCGFSQRETTHIEEVKIQVLCWPLSPGRMHAGSTLCYDFSQPARLALLGSRVTRVRTSPGDLKRPCMTHVRHGYITYGWRRYINPCAHVVSSIIFLGCSSSHSPVRMR